LQQEPDANVTQQDNKREPNLTQLEMVTSFLWSFVKMGELGRKCDEKAWLS
jgi:hypothetical protein